MRKMYKRIFTSTKLLAVPLICFALALSLGSTAWAADSEQSVGDVDSQGEGGVLLEKQVTLEKKSSDILTTSFGESYGVDDTTLIVDEQGQQVMLQYLLVPCDAELLYETKADGSSTVHRIKVISTHQGATNRMWGESN
jgi:hypothetical protein